MSETLGADVLVFAVIVAPPVAYLALQLVVLARWRGGWRAAALAPAAALALWVVSFALDVSRDPTARNLWPLELLLWATGALAFLLALALARRFGGARQTSRRRPG